jgi:hypothetical protein
MFDLSGLVPEARSVAQAVAEVYWRHTQPWFVGLMHGAGRGNLAHTIRQFCQTV